LNELILFQPDHFLKLFTVDQKPVFGRLDVLELSFDEAFSYPEQLDPLYFSTDAIQREWRQFFVCDEAFHGQGKVYSHKKVASIHAPCARALT
jgi:hypothetical protein